MLRLLLPKLLGARGKALAGKIDRAVNRKK